MKSILITGANRGLGLGFLKALLQHPNQPEHIFATYRDPAKSQELLSLEKQYKHLHTYKIDVTDFEAYQAFYEEVAKILDGIGLNLLYNNAGVGYFNNLRNTTSEDLNKTYKINFMAPILLTQTFYPLLKLAAEKNSTLQGIHRAAVINISSEEASIKDSYGGNYSYRCSKAALNAATKSMSIDFQSDKIIAISLHPGWVRTDMGGSCAPLSVQESSRKVLKTILSFSDKDNGRYLQYDGTDLNW
uniref:Putative short chain-type dehydrogenase n=1 Tax=Corethrella appendiculata TaxID=1370023 RepID=U5ENZ9_9DIPT